MEDRSGHFRRAREVVAVAAVFATIFGLAGAGFNDENRAAGFIIMWLIVYSWMVTFFLFDPWGRSRSQVLELSASRSIAI